MGKVVKMKGSAGVPRPEFYWVWTECCWESLKSRARPQDPNFSILGQGGFGIKESLIS